MGSHWISLIQVLVSLRFSLNSTPSSFSSINDVPRVLTQFHSLTSLSHPFSFFLPFMRSSVDPTRIVVYRNLVSHFSPNSELICATRRQYSGVLLVLEPNTYLHLYSLHRLLFAPAVSVSQCLFIPFKFLLVLQSSWLICTPHHFISFRQKRECHVILSDWLDWRNSPRGPRQTFLSSFASAAHE